MARTLAWAINRVRNIVGEPLHYIDNNKYSTGTVSVTSASASVTGSGTAWLTNAKAGQTFYISGGKYYHILTITSDTALTLTDVYAGATAGTASYTITAGNVTNASIVDNLISAQYEIARQIAQFDENLLATTGTISYVSGTAEYSLPTTNGLPKIILCVTRTDLDTKKIIHPINYQERLKYTTTSNVLDVDDLNEYWYRLGNSIGIVPTPTTSATNNITIAYIPIIADLTTDSSTFTIPDEYMDWLLYTAAGKSSPDAKIIAERDRLKADALATISPSQMQESRSVIYKDEDAFY